MTSFIDDWINELVSKIKKEYEDNVVFIGLQGSYQRKEASDNSDIDIVVILNELTMQNLKKYPEIISKMPYKEKACGLYHARCHNFIYENSSETLSTLYKSAFFIL